MISRILAKIFLLISQLELPVFFKRIAVVNQLVKQHLILRYRRTIFGYLWTLINPLMMVTVMAVVFSNFNINKHSNYVIFLFSGMIPWIFFNTAISQSTTAFTSNESLIKKIYLPKLIFPVSTVIAYLIDSILCFFAFLVIMFITGESVGFEILFVLFSYILLLIFIFGIVLIVSVATVFFRDLQHIIIVFLQGLFFITPIIYDAEKLTGALKIIIKFNPLSTYISLFREPIYYNSIPNYYLIFNAVLLSFISLLLGLIVFSSCRRKIVFRL